MPDHREAMALFDRSNTDDNSRCGKIYISWIVLSMRSSQL